MYLTNLKLWNFRVFGSVTPFDLSTPNLALNFKNGINVLIGENDSGKTAIIDAIKLVLKTHSGEWIKVEEEDFFQGTERMRIELRFEEFTADEGKYFTEWIEWVDDGKGGGKPCLTLYYDNKIRDGKLVPTDIKAGAPGIGHIFIAEAKALLKTTYLRPLRDAKAELSAKRNSRLSQILISHPSFEDKKGHRFLDLARELNKEVSGYFIGKDGKGVDLPAKDKTGKVVKDVMDVYLNQFARKNTHFKMADADLKGILETLSLLFEDGHNLGLGSHNLLCIASELLHLKKANWEGLRLGLIEEIEAHLHPQVQLLVVQTLLKEANNMQLIFTTHSPNIASKIPLENLILCNKGKAFPMDAAYTQLDKDDYKYLEIFLDTTKANLFFAKGVILVEGWAEELLIPTIAKVLGLDLTENGISIVNVGSSAYLHFAKIFKRQSPPELDIPVSIVTDLDIRTHKRQLKKDPAGNPVLDAGGEPEEEYVIRNPDDVKKEATDKMVKVNQSIGSIQYFIASPWTLEYALYESASMSGLFQDAVKAVHSRTDWKDFKNKLAEKLINKSLDKTAIAYKLANAILKKITANPTFTDAPLLGITQAKEDSDTIYYLIKAIKHAAGK